MKGDTRSLDSSSCRANSAGQGGLVCRLVMGVLLCPTGSICILMKFL